MARLSVNLNKIALLRNSRYTGVPDLLSYAEFAKTAGASGITVHPRPDERHIRRDDVIALARKIGPWRPAYELNLEGRPTAEFLDLIALVRPEQCTLVPDATDAFTSEKGWDLTDDEKLELKPIIAQIQDLGARVILFVDPDPAIASKVAETGADGLEIYTGSYAAAFRRSDQNCPAVLEAIRELGSVAQALGLVVNAGHDLNLKNIPPLLDAVPHLHEASIGHELTADSLLSGFDQTVRRYVESLTAHA